MQTPTRQRGATALSVRFARELRGGETGPDVEGVGRALARAGFLEGIEKFWAKAPGFRRTYNASRRHGVNKARAKLKVPQNGIYNLKVHDYLIALKAFDAYAAKLMLDYRPPPRIVYPFPLGAGGTVAITGLHPTAGLLGNWALDWMARGGTPVVAVEPAVIVKLSGRDPHLGADQLVGIYGYSIHYRTPAGYAYFATHMGWRASELYPGLRVEAGDLLGHVGSWPGNPPRSHLHLGVTSPLGPSDAKRRIQAVARAERIT